MDTLMKKSGKKDGLLPMLVQLGQGKQKGAIAMSDEATTADSLLPWSGPSNLSAAAHSDGTTVVTRIRAETTDDS